MKLKDLTQFPTDYLDAYCEAEFGHTNWAFTISGDDPIFGQEDPDVGSVVIFYKQPAEEEHE